MQDTQQTRKTGLIILPSWNDKKERVVEWTDYYPYYREHDFKYLEYLEKSLEIISKLKHADIIRCHSATLNPIHNLDICDLYWMIQWMKLEEGTSNKRGLERNISEVFSTVSTKK